MKKPVVLHKEISYHTKKETILVENGSIKICIHLNYDKGTVEFTDTQGDDEFIFSADLSTQRLAKWEAVVETLITAIQIASKKLPRKGVKK